jgi:twitching motility protein PilI
MANKQALRDLQSRLAERLQAARTEPLAQSWLAVECSSRGFLFPLREAGEIFALTPMVPVPHSHRWFLGVANLRGHLHGVVDLAGFLGVKAADSPRDQARLVGFNQSLDINCVLLVDRLSGLRSEDELTAMPMTTNRARPSQVRASAMPRRGSGRNCILPSWRATSHSCASSASQDGC